MKPRSSILLFSLVVFILAAVGMSVFYSRLLVLTFWMTLALIIAYPCTFIIFIPLLTADGKSSRKKVLLLALGMTILSVAVVNSVWTIITPRWAFSVSTNKEHYEIGEAVEISVSLQNMGFITHTFKSRISNPVVVSIERVHLENPSSRLQVWFTPYQPDVTEFSIGPNGSIERRVVWNQTKSVNTWSGEEIEAGVYWIHAFVPERSLGGEPMGVDNIFSAWTYIGILPFGMRASIVLEQVF